MQPGRVLSVFAVSFVAALMVAAVPIVDAQPQQQRGPGQGQNRGPGGPPGGPGGSAPMQRQATEADADTLLDESLVSDPSRIEAARQKAAEEPPAGADADTLTRFYAVRGQAARIAGNQAQYLEDLRRAAEHARKSQNVDKVQVLSQLANAESQVGRSIAAVRAIEEAIRENPASFRNRLITLNADLARYQLNAGNIPGADAAVVQIRQLRREMENNPRFGQNQGAQRVLAEGVGAVAAVLERKGQLTEAEAGYREARQMLIHLREPSRFQGRINSLQGSLANNLRLQGRLAEAENEARALLVENQRSSGTAGAPTARSLLSLSNVLAAQGLFPEAEGLTRRAIAIFDQGGQTGALGPRQVLAGILAEQGKWAEAHQQFETLRRATRTRPEVFANLTRRNPFPGVALLYAGKPADALTYLKAFYDRTREELGERHFVAAEARGFYAMALAANGNVDGAIAEYRGAAEILLTRSREASDVDDTGTASAADQRTRLIIDGYIDTLADLVAESFRLADAARGRSVVRALAASAARAAASEPALADIARRLQDVEKQVSALNGLLANAISARAQDRDEASIQNLRRHIDGLRDERGRLSAEIERKFPDYARLVNPGPATVADVQKTLRPGEAMLAVFSGQRRTYAWAVPKTGPAAMAVAPLNRDGLAATVAKLRKALDPNAQTLDDIPAFDVAEAHRLYAGLLQPAEAGWREAKTLFVVPDGALGQLPLALLVTAPTALAAADADGVPFSRYRAVPFLAKRVAVAQLPSVGSLAALRAVPAPRGERKAFVGFGDPWFNKEQAAEGARDLAAVQTAGLTTRGIPIRLRSAPKNSDYSAEYGQLPRLPDTADEVRSIAVALRADTGDVILGAKASPTTVKQMDLRNRRIVMFATHGLVPGDLSGLGQPALALSAPDVTGNPADGLLTVEDILALKLNADWVVLSACNTAAAQGAGAEAVSGLGRAFFYAGTRALLVSNWPVESSSARELTTDLFRRQVETAGLSRAEAMRQAMLTLIDGPGLKGPDGKALFSYAHPIFWAPFSLVGDGG
jgi:CHAT domain-containing protein